MAQTLEQALALAAQASEQGADLVEFRMDLFVRDPAAAAELVQRCPLPCIVTVRRKAEGGHFEGPDEDRVALLEAACSGPTQPAYLDFELASYQNHALRQRIDRLVDHPGQVRATGVKLVLSSHDFQSRPADLHQRIEAMAAAPACAVVKIAWMAADLNDNLHAFDLVAQQGKPAVALCMGEAGLPSRILSRKFNAPFTFVTLDDAAATAPGQPTLSQVRNLYRWDQITPATRLYAVIGHPVGHSMSPAIHNAGFDALGYDGLYLPMSITPTYEAFASIVGAWLDHPRLQFRGASVTIPHKENLLRFVRERGGEIEQLADRIGAANTLTVGEDGSLYASNSDYGAALDAVCDGLGIERREIEGLRVAVIGAGGAARAIVAGFAHYGATVVIYNRTLDKAQLLVEHFKSSPGKVVAMPLDKLCDSCCQVYINCTPLGMYPKVDDTPILPGPGQTQPHWEPGTVVFDTIYNPVYTRLLREARAAGCVTIPGSEMFVRQAATQFRLWTQAQAPMDVFRHVLAQRLGAR